MAILLNLVVKSIGTDPESTSSLTNVRCGFVVQSGYSAQSIDVVASVQNPHEAPLQCNVQSQHDDPLQCNVQNQHVDCDILT